MNKAALLPLSALRLPTFSTLQLTQSVIPTLLKVEKKLPLSVKESLLHVVPKILQPSLRLVPFSAQKTLLLNALNSIFSEAIEDGDFEFLQDKWLKISITDLQLTWWLSFDENQLVMASNQNAKNSIKSKSNKIIEDVSFSANGDDLILIAGRKQDPDTLFFQRRLKIEGDTELGLEVKNLIDAVDIDQLPSKVHRMVDLFAHFLQNTQDEIAAKKSSDEKR